MRSRLVVALLIIFGSAAIPCIGKETIIHNNTKTDSLFQLVERHGKQDEEKVRLLNEYARSCFYDMEFKKGLIAGREARLLSEKLHFDGGKIMYYLTLSVYNGSGSSANYYRKLAERLSMDPDQKLEKYYVTLQDIDEPTGTDWENLIIRFSDILKHFEQLGDKEIQANVLSDLSFFYFKLENYEESLRIQEMVVQLCKDLELVYPMFLASSNKIYNLEKLGRKEDIKELELELVEFISQNENTNTIGMITAAMASGYNGLGRYGLAIEYYLKSISAFEQNGDTTMLFDTYLDIASAYSNLVMYDKAAVVYEKAIAIAKQQSNIRSMYDVYNRAVFSNYYIKNYDKARKYMALALQEPYEQTRNYYLARQNSLEGQILKDQQEYSAAITYLQRALTGYIDLGKKNGNPFMTMYIAECYLRMGDYQKALDNALRSLEMEEETNLPRTKVKSELSLMLSEIYEELGQREKAYQYLKRYQEIRAENDKLDAANRLADAEVRDILEKSQRKINEAEQERVRVDQENRVQRLWILSISGALLSAIILAFVLYRNNKNKQKANALLKEQKEEIESTLEKLESTQSQLIQSEKMASLGELTAGIAHEIQNPLNFVNNFSEVNKELLEELKSERLKEQGERDEKLEEEILDDLINNEDKIKHHGQRAEGIVKGMLEHSRTGDGVKEPTDLNALADEYLRLAYHGLRAKDKSFNADFKSDFDPALPKVNVIPQDIGRVMLNLINNAFYSVSEASHPTPKTADVEEANESAGSNYKPLVIVSTKKNDNKIEISVSDNGPGIPDQIKDKIFQPFFTTKPTGSGTGLGLSLSYDIVKAHGGELKVESKKNLRTEFIIIIPI